MSRFLKSSVTPDGQQVKNIELSTKVLCDLPVKLAHSLFSDAPVRYLAPKERLFAAGDVGDGCYRLELGLLKVVVESASGEERIVALLGPGAMIGELSMIDGLPRSASIVAMRNCVLRFVSREAFELKARAHSEIRLALSSIVAARLRQADSALAATTFLTVKGRIARALLELAHHIGQDCGAGRIMLQDKISQGDLAAMAGVARENVSRVMSDWRKRNLVSQSARSYCINDPGALADEVDNNGTRAKSPIQHRDPARRYQSRKHYA
jgi:CRP/FNR family transcriptional regulator